MNEKIATSLRPVPATAGCSLQKSTGLFAHRSRPRNDSCEELLVMTVVGSYLLCIWITPEESAETSGVTMVLTPY